MSDQLDYQIETPPPTRVVEALRLVFRDLPEKERVAQVQEHLNIYPNDNENTCPQYKKILLGAYRQDCLVAAVLAQIQAGRTAVVWPPRLAEDEPQAPADAILQSLCEQLERNNLSMVHCLLETVSPTDDTILREAGFEPLAKLLYMLSSRDDFPEARPLQSNPEEQLDFEPYDYSNHVRLARIVEKTYEKTLDCPRLNNVRHIEDVLDGYRDTGDFSPSRWLIVRHQGKDIGCLLLADHPDHDSTELVYMGIIPSARGRDRGKQITQYAQWLTAELNRQRLVLAVDDKNQPAIEMYTSVGFRAWERRIIYAKFFPT
ncbi:MAG: GNAT family N-acetyltransferase [Pirellulales bacterium]|nr:GNAT family N-acetyltransferase [Pirellulales bacterium]